MDIDNQENQIELFLSTINGIVVGLPKNENSEAFRFCIDQQSKIIIELLVQLRNMNDSHKISSGVIEGLQKSVILNNEMFDRMASLIEDARKTIEEKEEIIKGLLTPIMS